MQHTQSHQTTVFLYFLQPYKETHYHALVIPPSFLCTINIDFLDIIISQSIRLGLGVFNNSMTFSGLTDIPFTFTLSSRQNCMMDLLIVNASVGHNHGIPREERGWVHCINVHMPSHTPSSSSRKVWWCPEYCPKPLHVLLRFSLPQPLSIVSHQYIFPFLHVPLPAFWMMRSFKLKYPSLYNTTCHW